MDSIIAFFSTPEGVALCSLITIASLIFGFLQKSKVIKISNEIDSKNNIITILEAKNIKLTQDITSTTNSNNELKLVNSQLTATVNNLEKGDLSQNEQSVSQQGKNNINNGSISGDFNLELS
jgi:hypothetical protein